MTIIMTGRGTHMKEIRQALNFQAIDRTSNRTIMLSNVDVFINYGLQGERLTALSNRLYFTGARPVLIGMNAQVNKLQACRNLSPHVKVPATISSIEPLPPTRPALPGVQWLRKPIFSEGGNDITIWDGRPILSQYYLQERIQPRRYELRVHAARWLPVCKWLVTKKTHPNGDNAVTWNHETGGFFSNIEQNESNTGVFARAKEAANIALYKLNQQFGAVDFVVKDGENPLVPYFLEVNLSPGFSTDSTRDWYYSAFRALSETPTDAIRARLESVPALSEIASPEAPTRPTRASDQITGLRGNEDMELVREALTHYATHLPPMPQFVQSLVRGRIQEIISRMR